MTRRGRLIVGAAVVAVTMSACAPGATVSPAATQTAMSPAPPAAAASAATSLSRTPHAPTNQPAKVDLTDVRMPLALEDSTVVDPGWTSLPSELDGILLGAVQREGHVEFTAIQTNGEALWTVQRPIGAAASLTRTSQGVPLAVITDTTDDFATTTATAYRLDSGDLAWGPVDVPGPPTGAGTVYAPKRNAQGGDAAKAVALQPDTGARLKLDGHEEDSVLGEFDGTVLVQAQGHVDALDGLTDTVRWSATNAAWANPVRIVTDGGSSDGLVMVEDAQASRSLIRIDTGAVIAEGFADAVVDPITSVIVTTSPSGLRAINNDGTQLWTNPLAVDSVLRSARGALLYTLEGRTVRVLNIMTGAVALAYGDSGSTIAVPERFLSTGAAVITVDGKLLLATSP